MEHIKITTNKKWLKADLRKLDYSLMYEYWLGAFIVIPKAIKMLPNKAYQNNKCLSWYDKQLINHNKVMAEFQRIWKR
tara:strand:- start:1 stop:234 length:234 start_codon:yes stop_codon:yes gene_type:complete